MDIIGTRLDALQEIKLQALYLERRFMSSGAADTLIAESELAALQDRFSDACRDFITPPMARAIRKDFNTFLALIDWAMDHYGKAGD